MSVLAPAGAIALQVHSGGARGWTTIADLNAGRFLDCSAGISRDGGTWGIAQDAQAAWQLVFAAPGSHGASPVTIDIDRGTCPFNRAGGDGCPVHVPVDHASLGAVRLGNWMTVSVSGGADATLSLVGSAAAILKVQECVHDAGVAPGAAPARTPV